MYRPRCNGNVGALAWANPPPTVGLHAGKTAREGGFSGWQCLVSMLHYLHEVGRGDRRPSKDPCGGRNLTPTSRGRNGRWMGLDGLARRCYAQPPPCHHESATMVVHTRNLHGHATDGGRYGRKNLHDHATFTIQQWSRERNGWWTGWCQDHHDPANITPSQHPPSHNFHEPATMVVSDNTVAVSPHDSI